MSKLVSLLPLVSYEGLKYVVQGSLLAVFVSLLFALYSLYALLYGIRNSSKSKRSLATQLLPPLFFALTVAAVLTILPVFVDRTLNRVEPEAFPEISAEAEEIHRKLWIADFHADSLLWPLRDLSQRNDYGHVDLPRLIQGNVALQAFTIVTGTPPNLNMEYNERPSILEDSITQKALIEGWGWASVTARAPRVLFQAERLRALEKQSGGQFKIIYTRQDLDWFIRSRSHAVNPKYMVSGFLGIEGLHALDGNISNIDLFFDAGVRMMGLTHFFDNELGGSAHGVDKGGLTEFGKQVVQRLEEKSILVDVAHASPKMIADVLEIANRPVVSSHTGVQGVCNNVRNLDDRLIRGIARTGGILGVGFFKPAICGNDTIESIVKTVKYIADMVGVGHVGLGSDYDGAVSVPFDSANLIHITNGLLRAGMTEEEIGLVMGGNILRLMLEVLPR